MKRLCAVIFIYLLVVTVFGQLTPIEIVNDAGDTNGKALVTKFREIIRRSAAYELTYSQEEVHFVVRISTMDRFQGESESEGNSTIYNYIILINLGDGTQLYCYSRIGFAGKNVLDEVAFDIFSDLDDFVERYKSYFIKN